MSADLHLFVLTATDWVVPNLSCANHSTNFELHWEKNTNRNYSTTIRMCGHHEQLSSTARRPSSPSRPTHYSSKTKCENSKANCKAAQSGLKQPSNALPRNLRFETRTSLPATSFYRKQRKQWKSGRCGRSPWTASGKTLPQRSTLPKPLVG